MKINPEKLRERLRESHETSMFVLDFVMLGLVILNLSWLLFDTFFASRLIQGFLGWMAPDFTHFYRDTVHSNFIVYDMAFVIVFLIEFHFRWMLAIHRKTYHRWFFYPFVHWYDLMGCIPAGSFRWLRLLRVISILYRLQKYQIIDLSDNYAVRFFIKYFNVLMEEISDRVVINVIDGVQDQIASGTPVVEKVIGAVLLPHKAALVSWIASRINDIHADIYQPHRGDLKIYVDSLIAESVGRDIKVVALERVPVLGERITEIIESTISDIVFNVVDKLAKDVSGARADIVVQEVTDLIIDRVLKPTDTLNVTGRDILIEVLEVIKEEVRVQRWKLEEVDA